MEQQPILQEPLGSTSISAALASSGCVWREVPFSREGWDGEFPDSDGLIKSEFGAEVTVTPESIRTPDAGPSLIGLLRPTLESPSYITSLNSEVSFHRAILSAEREVIGYSCVTVSKSHTTLSASLSPLHLDSLCDIRGGNLLVDADGEDGVFKALSLPFTPTSQPTSDKLLVGSLLVADFELASAVMGWGGEFFKSSQSIPPGARWITVHPNGAGSKGVPILVQPAKDNSGTYHVIGGAGGKLNLMKIRGVKSEAEYKQQHAERDAIKRQAKKEAIRRDKELGLHDAKVAAHEAVNAQRKSAQKDFISTVAQAMGWGEEAMKLDVEGLSPDALKKAELQHHARLLAQAKSAVETQRQVLIADLDRRTAAGLGEVPLDAGSDQLSVQDLDPIRIADTSGISHDFKARAEAAGLNQEKLDAQVAGIEKEEAGSEPDAAHVAAAVERGELARKVRDELKKVKSSSLQTSIVDAHEAVALLKAHKKLAAMEKAARDANRAVDDSTVEPKAYVLEVGEVTDESVAQSVEDDLRTAKARAFLAGVDSVGGEETVEAHVCAGAYNAVNALTQAVGGASLMDRSVVDVLGVAGAAQVLARRLHTDYADKAEEIAAGLEQYHVAHAPELQDEALAEAKELQDAAAEIELGEAANTADLGVASAMNRKRKEHLAAARKVMGQALGEMEAHASMIAAMRGGKRDFVQVSLGDASLESAVKQLWAIGLTDADYKIDRVAGNVFATVNAGGMDKLAAPVDRDNMERVARNLAIMKGEQDEDGWLPQGFADRADLGLNITPGVSLPLSAPFDATAADLAGSLRDYIGGRTADGDRAADILADVQSAEFFNRVGATRGTEYSDALKSVIPTKDANGKMVRVENLAPIFDGYADSYVSDKWGGSRSTLNRQTFEPDAVAQDALHRALCAEPAGISAFKPIGDLDNHDRKALRHWFAKNVAHESPEQAALREESEKILEREPERHLTDMFGEASENPVWAAWKEESDAAVAAVSAAGLDWNGYCHIMRGKVRAFEAVQDLVRSSIADGFAKHYNTLRPDAALKVGKTVVRNNLNHLGAVDPKEREARLHMERSLIDGLRERIGGQYASGSVGDKLDAAKEKQAAFGQAQMGFFASDDMFGGQSDTVATPLGADERHTIGHAAESMIGKMMGVVGKNFDPKQPVKLFNPSMSGPDGAKRQRAIKLIQQNKRVILGAGVGCVRGDTILDDVFGRGMTFAEWWASGDAPTVWAMTNTGDLVCRQASIVFSKGVANCREVVLDNGMSMVVSDNHLFLTRRGWVRSADVLPGDVFLHRALPLRRSVGQSLCGDVNVPRHSGIAEDCNLHYCCGHGQCDEQPRCELGIFQFASPSQSGVQKHTLERLLQDDLANAGKHNQPLLSIFPLSIEGRGHQFPQAGSVEHQQLVDAVALELLHGLLQETWLSGESFDCLRHTFEQYLEQYAQSLSENTLSVSDEFLRESGSCEPSLLKSQAPSLSLLSFEDACMSELLAQGEMLSVVPSDESSVVSVGVAGQYHVFDLNVPGEANYLTCGVIHHNSGKTGMMLGAFSHLHSQGLVKKGIIACPSIVQGQMGGEALRFLEAGKFNWHCEPGASFEERLKSYKDPETHFTVVTHQSFRDDLLKMAAMKTGETPEDVAARMESMSQSERAAFTKGVLDHHGVKFDFASIDEGHNLLNREGKKNSRMANVIDGVTDNAEYLISATGDPIKNDASEAFSLLQKMDGSRYSDRDAFMRRYGGDTQAAKDGLQRELARHLYAMSVNPDVQVSKSEVTVPQTEAQQAALDGVEKSAAALRIAKMTGTVNVDAAKAFAPNMFDGVPESDHEAVAKTVAEQVGVLKRSAIRRVLDNHPAAGKLNHVAEIAKSRKGQQGVVFAHSLAAVESIRARLEADGHRVITISGKDSSQDKSAKIKQFNPESGDASADIIVCSDAGATGANLQSGRWLCQYDCPDTAMTHAQRQGRINRIGQKNAVELIDLIADHENERNSRSRLATKYGLRDLMTSPLDGIDDTGLAYYLKQNGFGEAKPQSSLF